MADEIDSTEAEEWRDVPEWPGYLVSTLGRVRGPRRMLKQHLDRLGYIRVPMTDRPGGRRKNTTVHTIVTSAFLGPRDGRQVNHKNNIRHDNRLENLEYVTASQNSQHRRNFGTFPVGGNNGRAKLTSEQAAAIRERYSKGEKQRYLANEFGVAHGTIWWVVHGLTWSE